MTVALLDPSQYRRTLWKNGGGTTLDIAYEGETWRFSRTPIAAPGPFSDYTGFDRIQMLVTGRGLVLETPDGEIDLRTPFRPMRFAGETPITSRLEAGPVEVLNLIGARAAVRLDLQVLEVSEGMALGPGIHVAYCSQGTATLNANSRRHVLAADHALHIEEASPATLECVGGRAIIASICPA